MDNNPTSNLPANINTLSPSGIDLIYDYWTPDTIGEHKNLYFHSIRVIDYANEDNSEVKALECAVFIERVQDKWRTIVNGSSRLVNGLKNAGIKSKEPVQIVFQGKAKNKTNSYSSDTWSIYRLSQS